MKSRVLIVDDIALNRQLIIEYLKDQPLEIVEASDGNEAVERAGNEIDMVLMDIKMPKKGGVEALKVIKKSHPALPVIAITASSFLSIEQEFKDLGFDGYLRKPVSQPQLLSKLAKFIGKENSLSTSSDLAVNTVDSVPTFHEQLADHPAEELLELEELLDEVFIPELNRLGPDIILFDQHAELINKFEMIIKKYRLKSLAPILHSLSIALDQFDVEKAQRLLSKLPDVVGEIKQAINNISQIK